MLHEKTVSVQSLENYAQMGSAISYKGGKRYIYLLEDDDGYIWFANYGPYTIETTIQRIN